MSNDLIYLATPYSNFPAGLDEAYEQASAVLYTLLSKGAVVFCPIVHCHNIAKKYDLPKDWSFWKNIDFTFISKCDKMCVVKMDGWDISTGVNAEIKEAERLNIPVEYIKV